MKYDKHHTIHALAHNEPGVLNKLFSLLRRKRYNVEGITAGHTNTPGISRMTITFSHEEGSRIDQIVRQIQKITEVTYAEDVTEGDVFIHELVMLKVKADAKNRADIIRTAETMRGRILHIGVRHVIIEIAGSRGRVQNALEVFGEIGILDIARTGQVAMDRGTANPPDSYGL
jgi:acetolactate synthase-1/3 small subunit